MWLLDARTYRLHAFVGDEIPPYAILSHRWQENEVTFSSFRECGLVESVLSESLERERQHFPFLGELQAFRMKELQALQGWRKVDMLCKTALSYHLSWAWIDTACIDKSSSAELQESINSMFKWYRDAYRCFVYMGDVWVDEAHSVDRYSFSEQISEETLRQFRESEWFKRAWTLQELLAPTSSPIYFDHRWRIIGHHTGLMQEISTVTQIKPRYLRKNSQGDMESSPCSDAPIAMRMFWASKRSATREEDIAYSLLGIFKVNIPLLYGEGRKNAFRRLQMEIMNESGDETIFAWSLGGQIEKQAGARRGPSFRLLAMSPGEFQDSLVTQPMPLSRRRFHTVQDRLSIEGRVIKRKAHAYLFGQVTEAKGLGDCLFPLRCKRQAEDASSRENTVLLQLLDLSMESSEFVPIGPCISAYVDWDALEKNVKETRISIFFDGLG